MRKPTLSEERHLAVFTSLTPEQTAHLCMKLQYTATLPDCPMLESGEELFRVCADAGLDHARVTLSLARETTDIGVSTIEHLVGRPITRWKRPEVQKRTPITVARASSSPRAVTNDNMVILSVQPNKKKVGSAAHDRYAIWQVGRTLAECRRLGITAADVAWDTERGFVILGAAEEYAASLAPKEETVA